MRSVHRSCVLAACLLVVVLLTVVGTGVLGARGALVALSAGAVGLLLLAHAAAGAGRSELGPADAVTLVRLVLSAVVCGLVLDPVRTAHACDVAAGLALLAIALDGVDGRVARRTGTASDLGARFDMETDAFLILVLSLGAAPVVGPWVLLVGAARYLFVAAARVAPWLSAALPPRPWRRVVAAVTGVVLAVVLPDRLPGPLQVSAAAVVTLLVAESFGRDVVWLARRREPGGRGRSASRVRGAVAVTIAVAVLWAALVVPDSPGDPVLRLPLELVVLAALVVVLPWRAARVVAPVVGLVVGLSAVLRALDLGVESALGRPFRPTSDWAYAGSARDLLVDTVGPARALALAALALVAAAVLVVGPPWASWRLARAVAPHRTRTAAQVAVGAVVAATALTVGPVPDSAARALVRDVGLAASRSDADARYAAMLSADSAPTGDLALLRGKDVLVVFVESYGRVALETVPGHADLRAQLDSESAALAAHGIGARSAFLTSPTFGGLSWLAHATLQSGLWVDSQQRYDELVAGRHPTLASVLREHGWRTVAVVPANERPWPEGVSFYGYDAVHDATSMGYRGPVFGYAPMPDQYTLDRFGRTELVAGHAPVMAEIDLVSSHTPWAPLPRLVPWSSLGDGSVFDGMPAQGRSAAQVWSDGSVRTSYLASVRYSMAALTSWLARLDDPDLVVLVLGDHEPATVVSGTGASHDVPVSLLSTDPRLLARAGTWGWQPGLDPTPGAPVWPMSAVRDRLVRTFSTAP